MLGPTLVFLLLLLLPPSPLLGSRSTSNSYVTQDQGHNPSSQLQESPANGESCWSTYDVYFVLDSSDSVNNNWMFTQSFVEDLVNKFKNPKQRMSFITYSTHGHINMELTSDRRKINTALVKLLNVLPRGATNMQHGLRKANEQMQRMSAAGKKAPSLIIALTGGELLPESFEEAEDEAAKSEKLGAALYFVGMHDYQKHQLLELAGIEDHVLGVESGYSGLEDIVDSLIARSCVQITSVDISAICTRDKIFKVFGKGFQNVHNSEVICQFRVGKKTIRIRALSVEDTSITCPRVKIRNAGQAIFIDISLNNGLSFIKTDFSISRKTCAAYTRTPATLPDDLPLCALQDALLEDTEDTDLEGRSSSPDFPNLNTLYWAVPLLVLPFILLLCCCILRKCIKSKPPPKSDKGPASLAQSCGNHEKEKTRELEYKLGPLCDLVETCTEGPQRCDSAIPLMMPHCGSLSCHAWSHHQSSGHCSHLNSCCSWCQGLQPSWCQLSDDAYPCCSLHAPESRFAPLTP